MQIKWVTSHALCPHLSDFGLSASDFPKVTVLQKLLQSHIEKTRCGEILHQTQQRL